MSRWFRHYAGMMRDEKLVGVALRCKQPVERVIWVWGAILESAAEINDGGRYELDTAEVAYFLRSDESDVVSIAAGLEGAGRLRENHVVKWGDRQFQSDRSASRQKNYRDRQRATGDGGSDGHGNDADGQVTPPSRHGDAPETELDTETKTEKKEPRACALVGDWPSDAFDQFWVEYPTKIAKKAAFRAFATAKRSGVTFDRLMFGLARYKTEKPSQIEWCHPATWLNGGRWDDQPAATIQGTQNAPKDRSLTAALDRAAEYFGRADGLGDEAGAPVLRVVSQS